MATAVFHNLPVEKQQVILAAARQEFEAHLYHEALVKRIVEQAGIPRGSFYQYFEDLGDCYFTVLHHYLEDTHQMFLTTLREEKGQLAAALESYGEKLQQTFYGQSLQRLYRTYYLSWTQALGLQEAAWQEKNGMHGEGARQALKNDRMYLLKAAMHDLVCRSFLAQWPQDVFQQKYRQTVGWLIGGIEHDGVD